MKQIKSREKKELPQQEKKLEQRYYGAFIGLLIFFVISGLFEPIIIGYDKRYLIYIFLMPTLTGMLLIGIYHKKILTNHFTSNKNFTSWTLMLFSYLIFGFLFSYLSLGQIARTSWNYINNEVIKQNSQEVINCPITRFWTGKKSCIDFTFNNKHESIQVDYQKIKNYKDKNLGEFYLKVTATKGLWNYYRVDKWSIEQR